MRSGEAESLDLMKSGGEEGDGYDTPEEMMCT